MTDHLRSEAARRRREAFVAGPEAVEPPSLADVERDDTLILLFMCCHSALSPPSAIALTLRAGVTVELAAVGGRGGRTRTLGLKTGVQTID
jgi:predicted RNA polymerase sigma factor